MGSKFSEVLLFLIMMTIAKESFFRLTILELALLEFTLNNDLNTIIGNFNILTIPIKNKYYQT